MSAAGTPRRPSAATSEGIASPPIPRRVSSSSTTASFSDSPHNADRKKRNRTLLRDYYGLGPPSNKGDTLDLDSPDTFNASQYLNNLTTTASLPDLLRRETELVNEIRELDGERQSLVYNHHHELIQASDTIRKMKSRAEALDTSLDSLKTSFERISQLSTSLTPPSTTSPRSSSASISSSVPRFSPLRHLPPLLSLPILLKLLDKKSSDLLWGSWEPALRSWEDENVEGVEEVGRECREVLRSARRGSVSVGLGSGTAGDGESKVE
ncbi:COG1/VPS51 family protein [Sporobolomyces salmoneus]|uniref:COG1/VPS51 family protein n=1 Tax=Sporobolomyces salmoneus TaxID=183962 RepID=UPI003172D056